MGCKSLLRDHGGSTVVNSRTDFIILCDLAARYDNNIIGHAAVIPFVRVPTTLLTIVDASVGVKNGADYCCEITDETYKNRIGSFYAPSSCLL